MEANQRLASTGSYLKQNTNVRKSLAELCLEIRTKESSMISAIKAVYFYWFHFR